jgi:hypothetical protein
MRNFIPSALAFLMKETARLQSRKNMVDLGETAIGRVAPEDSGLWWITLLHAYTKWTGDNSLAESPNSQMAMHLILRLCLSEGCDTSPALLCADGCSMIDRRMVGCPPYFCFLIMFDDVSLVPLMSCYKLIIQLHPCKSGLIHN